MPILTPPQISAYAKAAGFTTPNENFQAVIVALAESGGNTGIVNKSSGNVGLWQIGPKGTRNDAGVGMTAAQLKDPATNARAARTIYIRAGKSWAKDWAVWNNGAAGKEAAKLLGPGWQSVIDAAAGGVGDAAGLAGQGTGNILNATGAAVASTVGEMQKGVLGQLGTVLSWLTTPAKWLRVAYVVGGGVLVVAGMQQLAKPVTAPVVGAVKTVVAPAATLAKKVAK